MDWFGLGIMLQARDNASDSIMKVNQSLTALTDNLGKTKAITEAQVEEIQYHLESLGDSILSGMGMQQLGESFMSLSGSLISPIQDVAKETIKTGSQFEEWRMTLKALYKDADLAKEKLNWGMNLAANTPFEVSDVTQALIGFKAMGVEADTILTSTEGITQSMLEFVGDLAALRPDIGLNSVMIGVRNLMGGDGGRSLKARLDLPLEEVLGREFSDDTEGLLQDIADLSSKVAGGLMSELKGTWNQYISNLQDQKDRFFLAIADTGAFDSAKGILQYFAEAVDSIDDEKMTAIGKGISEALNLLIKPLGFVANRLTDLFKVTANIMAQSPLIAKFITTFLALAGGLTAVTGAVLIFGGTFLIAVNGIKLFLVSLQGLRGSLAFVGTALRSSLMSINKFALAGALIYGIWKTDFGGIRSILQSFMNNIHTAFSYSTEIANMSVGDMMDALSQLDTHTFGGWLTLQLVRLQVLWMGLCDAWNDYTLSDDNFQKLRELGLLPIIETILDLKMRAEAFWEGFKKGWKEVSDVVQTVFETISKAVEKVVTSFFPLQDGVDEIKESTDKLDFTNWERLGEAVAIIGGLLVAYKIGSTLADISGKVITIGKDILGLPSKVATGFFAVKDGAETIYLKMLYAKDGVGSFIDKVKSVPKLVLDGAETVYLQLQYAKDGAKKFVEVVKNIPTKAIEGVSSAWTTVKDTISGAKDTFIKAKDWVSQLSLSTMALTVKTWLLNAAQTAMNVVQGIWNALCAVNPAVWVIVGIVALIAILVLLWNKCEGFREAVLGILSALGEGLKALWNNVLQPLLQFVLSVFAAGFKVAFDMIKEVIKTAVDTVIDVFGALKRVFTGIIDFVVGVFTGDWKRAWQGVQDIFGGIFEGMVALAKAPINAIIGCVNAMIRGINNVQFNVPDWVPAIGGKGLSFNISEIPKLNTGGYIKDEGISMLHPNEVVINDPLTRKLRAFLDGENEKPISEKQQENSALNDLTVKVTVVNDIPKEILQSPQVVTPSNSISEVVNNTTEEAYNNQVVNNTTNEELLNQITNNTLSKDLYNQVTNTDLSRNTTRNLTNTSISKDLYNEFNNNVSKDLYNNLNTTNISKDLVNNVSSNNISKDISSQVNNTNLVKDITNQISNTSLIKDISNQVTNSRIIKDMSNQVSNNVNKDLTNNLTNNTLNKDLSRNLTSTNITRDLSNNLNVNKEINSNLTNNNLTNELNNQVTHNNGNSLIKDIVNNFTNNNATKELINNLVNNNNKNTTNNLANNLSTSYNNNTEGNTSKNLVSSVLNNISKTFYNQVSNIFNKDENKQVNNSVSRDLYNRIANTNLTKDLTNQVIQTTNITRELASPLNTTNLTRDLSTNNEVINNNLSKDLSNTLTSNLNNELYNSNTNNFTKDLYNSVNNNVSKELISNISNNVTKDLYNQITNDTNEVYNNIANKDSKDLYNSTTNTNRKELYNSVSSVNTSNNSKSLNNSNKTEHIDNSVTFSEGAIQVTLTNGDEADVEKLFKEIAKRLKREQSLRNTLNYKPVLR